MSSYALRTEAATTAYELGRVVVESRRPLWVWTPIGLQRRRRKGSVVGNSLSSLVGPVRFELTTSCTPSKILSITYERLE